MTTRAARRAETERIAKEERQKLVDHAAGGLRLTPGAQGRINRRGRSIVAAPEDEAQRRDTIATAGRSSSLPADVLLHLTALGQLADEGNRFAAILFESECKRLGVWVERRVWSPRL